MKSRILIILFVFCCAFCSAQEGNYFYRNYTPAQAGGSAEQNWGITQDNEGRIYVANLNGIYLHDGKTWEWIQLRNNASCTSVARNTEGVIYVGGLNEFGFLERNTKGSIVYRSISKQLNDPNLDFGTIWKIISIDNKTYFCSNTHIFLYENNKLKTIQDLENGFH